MNLTKQLQRAKRSARITWRKFTEASSKVFDAAELLDLQFYQFKARTATFFFDRFGRTAIAMRDTPHYAFAQALAAADETATMRAELYYADYLRASWPVADHPRIPPRIADFRAHFEHMRKGKKQPNPILTHLEIDGPAYIVDGNHRCAFAAALGAQVEGSIWPYDLAFLAFYGTGRKKRPYQSILYRGRTIVPGWREDAATRMGLIPRHVLEGRRVLDVASNFGMSSLLAWRAGATQCLGLEQSAPMVNFASRFAMFEGAFPQVQFQVFDVDTDAPPLERFDTALIFSLYDHLNNPSGLNDLVERCVNKWVIFEAHPGGRRGDYDSFFRSGLFSSVTELGRLGTSVDKADCSRTLWLCEKL